MRLGTIFGKHVVMARPGTSLGEVVQLMEARHVGAVVIVAEQQIPVGIVTDRDVAIALGVRGLTVDDPVDEVMTMPVTTLDWDQGIFEATQAMRDLNVRRLPVVNQLGHLVGLVSLDDLLVLLGREINNLAQGVKPEIDRAATVGI